MRVYKTQHSYYCGVDLHARSMALNVCDSRLSLSVALADPVELFGPASVLALSRRREMRGLKRTPSMHACLVFRQRPPRRKALKRPSREQSRGVFFSQVEVSWEPPCRSWEIT